MPLLHMHAFNSIGERIMDAESDGMRCKTFYEYNNSGCVLSVTFLQKGGAGTMRS